MPAPAPEQENPPISEKIQTPSLEIKSIQEINGVIQQKPQNQNQENLNKTMKRRKRQKFQNIQTIQRIENNQLNLIDVFGQDNQQQIKPQLNQMTETLNDLKNQPPQFFQQEKQQQIQDLVEPELLTQKISQVQLNKNQSKITTSSFQEQSTTSILANKGIKLKEFELQCIQRFLNLQFFLQFRALHAFFNTIYTYEPDLSRPIRFNLVYLRVVHSLCLSTVFDESYNIQQQIIISVVSSIIIMVGVSLITVVHKIPRIGPKLSAFFMVCLLIFYYYVILAVVSNEESSYANSKYISFFLVIAIDFVLVQSTLSLFKISILRNVQNMILFYKLYTILGLDKFVASLTI
ncbi:hypothetical protein ABPG73_012423 [Tetrahymena malaccensis]